MSETETIENVSTENTTTDTSNTSGSNPSALPPSQVVSILADMGHADALATAKGFVATLDPLQEELEAGGFEQEAIVVGRIATRFRRGVKNAAKARLAELNADLDF